MLKGWRLCLSSELIVQCGRQLSRARAEQGQSGVDFARLQCGKQKGVAGARAAGAGFLEAKSSAVEKLLPGGHWVMRVAGRPSQGQGYGRIVCQEHPSGPASVGLSVGSLPGKAGVGAEPGPGMLR